MFLFVRLSWVTLHQLGAAQCSILTLLQQTHVAAWFSCQSYTQNAPRKMAGGCSAFLHRGGLAEWKTVHT